MMTTYLDLLPVPIRDAIFRIAEEPRILAVQRHLRWTLTYWKLALDREADQRRRAHARTPWGSEGHRCEPQCDWVRGGSRFTYVCWNGRYREALRTGVGDTDRLLPFRSTTMKRCRKNQTRPVCVSSKGEEYNGPRTLVRERSGALG